MSGDGCIGARWRHNVALSGRSLRGSKYEPHLDRDFGRIDGYFSCTVICTGVLLRSSQHQRGFGFGQRRFRLESTASRMARLRRCRGQSQRRRLHHRLLSMRFNPSAGFASEPKGAGRRVGRRFFLGEREHGRDSAALSNNQRKCAKEYGVVRQRELRMPAKNVANREKVKRRPPGTKPT